MTNLVEEYIIDTAMALRNASDSELIELMDYNLNKIYEIGEYDE